MRDAISGLYADDPVSPTQMTEQSNPRHPTAADLTLELALSNNSKTALDSSPAITTTRGKFSS
jgi:hypothetical protein